MLDPSGNATASWGVGGQLFASTLPGNSSNWQPSVQIGNVHPIASSVLGVDGNGAVTAVWIDPPVSMKTSRLTPEGSWSAEVLLTSAVTEPSLAVNDAGDAITVYAESSSTARPPTLMSRRFSPSSGWAAPMNVPDSVGPTAARVALAPNGAALVVWQFTVSCGGRCALERVAASWADPGNSWSAATQLSPDERFSAAPHVTFEPSGSAVVWLIQGNAERIPTLIQRRFTAGTWEPEDPVNQQAVNVFDMTSDPLGNTYFVWPQADGADYQLTARIESAGSSRRGAIKSQLGLTQVVDVPASNFSEGETLIIWQAHDGNNQTFHYIPDTGEIKTYNDALCLDTYGGGHEGNSVGLWSCHGGANQKWQVLSTGEIKTANGLCLDASGGSAANSTPLIVWSCQGGLNQRWQFLSLFLNK